MKDHPQLRGEGLLLVPLVDPDDDAVTDFLLQIAADEASRQWSPSLRSFTDRDAVRAWISHRAGTAHDREWLVLDEADGRRLGRVSMHRHGSDDAPDEVGYWTHPEARGRGAARRATRLVARYAHEQLGLRRVGLIHAVANPASCRVAMAASFPLEGTLRAALDHGDGVLWDMHVHARLAEDPWEPLPVVVPAGGPPRLDGDGFVLRAWTLDDGDALRAAATDPLVAAWNPFTMETEADLEAYVVNRSTGLDNLGWAIADPGTDEVLGYMSVHKIDLANACGEVGYWVVPAARGRGLAARAVDVVTAYATSVLGLARLELYHSLANERSCAVAEKAGYACEGVRRLGYRYPDGTLHDEHLHAFVLAPDEASPGSTA